MAEPEYIEIKMEPPDYVETVDENCFEILYDKKPDVMDEPVVQMLHCDKCNLSFLTRKRLHTHIKKLHPDLAATMFFSCDVCDLSYDNLESLQHHNLKLHRVKQEIKIEPAFTELNADNGDNFSDVDDWCKDEKGTTETSNEVLDDSEFKYPVVINNYAVKQVKKGSFFICHECNSPFKDKQHLKIHMARKHNHDIEKYKFKCDHCPLQYDKKNSLRAHEIRIHKKIRDDLYVCKPCGEEFDNYESFEKHEETDKHTERIATKKPFLNIEDFSNDNAEGIECDICFKKTKNSDALALHKRRIHSKDNHDLHTCEFCPMIYSKRDSLAKHIIRKHATETAPSNSRKKRRKDKMEDFKCVHCDKEYKNFDSLRAHIRRKHNPKSGGNASPNMEIPCDVCALIFASESRLRAHKRNKHNIDSNMTHKCGTCTRAYASMESLQKHIAKKHMNATFKCKKCLSKFNTQELLDEHRKNPCSIKCVFCVKRFTSMHYVMKHQRARHPSAFRFFCEICGLAYHMEDALKKHIRYAHKEKSHSCPECDKAFKTRGEMNKHLVMKHKKSEVSLDGTADGTIDGSADGMTDNRDGSESEDALIDMSDIGVGPEVTNFSDLIPSDLSRKSNFC